MLQHVPRAAKILLVALACTLTAGCNRTPPAPPKSQKKSPTVASLVPAATDLILGMGAGDHLVAVSNYNVGPEVSILPKVGDYQSVDWEKITVLRPNVLISFYGPGHTPAGFLDKVRELNITHVNVKLDRLEEIYDGITRLGEACSEPAKAATERKRLSKAIETIRERYKDKPRIPALITISPSGSDLVGPGTFFDDLLQAAGGSNVITGNVPYPSLDREALMALRPEVIVQLLPERNAQIVAQARAAWKSLPSLPAVRNDRIYIFTEPYIMQPGPHLAETAARIAAALHPMDAPSGNPTTKAAP